MLSIDRPIDSEGDRGVIEGSNCCQLVEEGEGKVGKGESLVGKSVGNGKIEQEMENGN